MNSSSFKLFVGTCAFVRVAHASMISIRFVMKPEPGAKDRFEIG